MCDVATANFLVSSIGGGGRVNEMVHKAANTLKRMFPHDGDARNQWTERRLRAWWNNESDRVLHWQMLELYKAAEAVKNEQAMLERARKEHAEFIAKTASVAALVELAEKAAIGGGFADDGAGRG